MCKAGLTSLLLAATASLPIASWSQTTPGQINDPSTYRGSMANQAQEQQASQQQEAANQQMQQRLDQNYAAYAPRGGGGGRASGGMNLKSKPLLPPARNPLVGRWRQVAAKEVDVGVMGALPGVGSVVSGAFAGGCQSIFGKGTVAFTPSQFNWVAPDGHEEILNHVEYRSDGANVIVIPTDSDLPLIFGLPDHDHVVVAFLGCRMERVGANPVRPSALTVSPSAGPGQGQGQGQGQGILDLKVGETLGGRFSAVPAGTQIWVTLDNPDSKLAEAGFAPDPGVPPIEKLFAACKASGRGGDQEPCRRGMQAMTGGALGVARTDPSGHARTGALQAGRYYVVGFVPYKGHSLMWHLPVDVKAGTNAVDLDPRNGSISH
jgi:hypothetical protein